MQPSPIDLGQARVILSQSLRVVALSVQMALACVDENEQNVMKQLKTQLKPILIIVRCNYP